MGLENVVYRHVALLVIPGLGNYPSHKCGQVPITTTRPSSQLPEALVASHTYDGVRGTIRKTPGTSDLYLE